MRYYVLSDDGQKFGPADIQTLNQWIAENRLLPTQMLEEEASGARFAARSVPGLNFPPPVDAGMPGQPQPGQPQAGYYRPPGGTMYSAPGDDGSRDITPAWVLFGVGLLGCCFFPYISLILAGIGTFFANKGRQKGHPQGTVAFVLNVALLVLAILWLILFLFAETFANQFGIRRPR